MAKLKRKSRHSPAGLRWLEQEKRKTKPVYFRHIRRKTAETRLRGAGISDEDLGSLGMSRKKRKR